MSCVYKTNFRVSLFTRIGDTRGRASAATDARSSGHTRAWAFRREQRAKRRDGGRIFRDSGEWAKNRALRRIRRNMGAIAKEREARE